MCIDVYQLPSSMKSWVCYLRCHCATSKQPECGPLPGNPRATSIIQEMEHPNSATGEWGHGKATKLLQKLHSHIPKYRICEQQEPPPAVGVPWGWFRQHGFLLKEWYLESLADRFALVDDNRGEVLQSCCHFVRKSSTKALIHWSPSKEASDKQRWVCCKLPNTVAKSLPALLGMHYKDFEACDIERSQCLVYNLHWQMLVSSKSSCGCFAGQLRFIRGFTRCKCSVHEMSRQ